MENIISQEIFHRENLLAERDFYFDIFSKYTNIATNILKFMHINVNNYEYTFLKSLNSKFNTETEKFMKKHFDKIFVITKNTNIKKFYQLKDKFIYFNTSFELFFEFDEDNPNNYMDYIDYKHKDKINIKYWCKLNTLYNILNIAKINNYKKTLILSEDVLISVNLHEDLKFNKDLYKKSDIILFEKFDIYNMISFAVNNNCIDVILNNIMQILNCENNNIFNNIQNIIEIKDIFLSNIKKNEIVEYLEKQKSIFDDTILNANKNQNIIKNIKNNYKNNRYVFQKNNKLYYLSCSYDNLLENNKKYYEYLKNKNIALIGPSPSIKKNKNGDEINDYDAIIKINNSIFCNDDYEYTGNRIDVLYTLSIAQNLNQIDIKDNFDTFQEYFFHLIKEKNVKYIIFSNELHCEIQNQWLALAIYKFSEIYNITNVPIIFMNKNIVDEHIKNSKKIPSAGYGAILHLLQHNIKKLYIKGFTFFKDGHTSSYIGKEWKEKVEKKSNEKTKENFYDEELREKVMHSLVKNDFINLAPHNFDYEYNNIKNISKNDLRINFDETIKYLYE